MVLFSNDIETVFDDYLPKLLFQVSEEIIQKRNINIYLYKHQAL